MASYRLHRLGWWGRECGLRVLTADQSRSLSKILCDRTLSFDFFIFGLGFKVTPSLPSRCNWLVARCGCGGSPAMFAWKFVPLVE